jgi:hypothetical protein
MILSGTLCGDIITSVHQPWQHFLLLTVDVALASESSRLSFIPSGLMSACTILKHLLFISSKDLNKASFLNSVLSTTIILVVTVAH